MVGEAVGSEELGAVAVTAIWVEVGKVEGAGVGETNWNGRLHPDTKKGSAMIHSKQRSASFDKAVCIRGKGMQALRNQTGSGKQGSHAVRILCYTNPGEVLSSSIALITFLLL